MSAVVSKQLGLTFPVTIDTGRPIVFIIVLCISGGKVCEVGCETAGWVFCSFQPARSTNVALK